MCSQEGLRLAAAQFCPLECEVFSDRPLQMEAGGASWDVVSHDVIMVRQERFKIVHIMAIYGLLSHMITELNQGWLCRQDCALQCASMHVPRPLDNRDLWSGFLGKSSEHVPETSLPRPFAACPLWVLREKRPRTVRAFLRWPHFALRCRPLPRRGHQHRPATGHNPREPLGQEPGAGRLRGSFVQGPGDALPEWLQGGPARGSADLQPAAGAGKAPAPGAGRSG